MADDIITAFPPYYDEVPMSRGTAGWENPPYYLTAYGLAVKHGFTGTEEEWLDSLRGDPGPDIVILGHFDTLAELEETITEPVGGDFYEVGSGSSQLVYYWCDMDDAWLPLDLHGPQGETGPAGADGTPGADGADGASAYQQAVEAGYTGTEQEFMALLAELPGYTEQARLWAVAAGSEATAAEGYAEAAEAAAANGVFFGVCSTAADTAAKEVTIPGVTTLYDGLKIRVLFEETTSQSHPTLNVNSLGAVPLVARGISVSVPPSIYAWSPGETIDLVYCSAEWRMSGFGVAGQTYYGRTQLLDSVSSTLTDRAATPNAVKTAYDAAVAAQQKPGTITLSLSWSGSGPWMQTVTVTGATVTSNSRIDLMPTAAQLAQLIADGVAALTVENNAGTLTAYALGAAPTSAMTIDCTVTEVET